MKYEFKIEMTGRCGSIICSQDNNSLEVDCEISGSSEYSILLAPMNLKRWNKTDSGDISKKQQLDILAEMRIWLQSQNIITNLEYPTDQTEKGKSCIAQVCSDDRLENLMYCKKHFDETLLY